MQTIEQVNEAIETIRNIALPGLSGSAKQVAWATTIRQEYFDRVLKAIARQERFGGDPMMSNLPTVLHNATYHFTDVDAGNASYWIDERVTFQKLKV